MSAPPPGGIPLPGSSSVVVQRQPLLYGQPPPPQPQVMQLPHYRTKSDLETDVQEQFDELEDRNQQRYHSILAAVVILGLLIIAGVVVGFVIVGLEVRDTRNRVKSIQHEVNSIWESLGGGGGAKKSSSSDDHKKHDSKSEDEDYKSYLYKKSFHDWMHKLEYSVKDIKSQLDDIQNCTEDIKTNVSRSSKLPASALLCEPQQEIRLPAATNVLISANLTSRNRFVRTSVGYNPVNGEVIFRPPNLNTTENLSIKLQIQVVINEAGGVNDTDTGTYVLTVSTSPTCEFGVNKCTDGIFWTSRVYKASEPEFGGNILIMNLDKIANVQGNTDVRFFVFLRSNSGNGVILPTTASTPPCAMLSITVEPLTPVFAPLPAT